MTGGFSERELDRLAALLRRAAENLREAAP
jgi:hypothetical protein